MKVEGKTAKPSKSKATKRSHEKAFFLAFSTQRIGGQRTPFKPMRGFRWLQIASLGGLKKKERRKQETALFLFVYCSPDEVSLYPYISVEVSIKEAQH